MTRPDGSRVETPRRVSVRFATVRLVGDDVLPLDFSATLRRALVAGSSVQRYGRTWHVGPLLPVPERPGSVSSRIGYEATSEAFSWDAEAQDWITVESPSNTVYPFVLDTETGRLAYQARASAGLLSALQALLNVQGQGRWRVERIMVNETFAHWRSSVTRVSKLRLMLRRPNPNYAGRPRVESLIEEANAALIRLVMEAPQDDLEGIDLEAEYIQQAIDHTVDRGYGSLRADGEQTINGELVERRYDSVTQGGELIQEVEASATGVDPGALSDALDTVGDDPLVEAADDDEHEDT